jgi:hypothetical protein
MPGIALLPSFLDNLRAYNQNQVKLSTLGGDLTLEKYAQIIKPFIRRKASPDNLATEIQSRANTEAVLMVLDNKSGVIKHITNKFFLSAMQMSMKEKFQLMETFGAANLTFFGESARVYVFSAQTIDASSQDSGIAMGKYYHQSSILKMYNEVLRGSQLIKDNKIAVLKVNNHIIYGYPLNLQVNYDANTDPLTSFVLQFVVSEHSLELPGVVKESYLEKLYSPDAHLNNEAIFDFILRIDHILSKIEVVLSTKVVGEEYNSSGTIESIEMASFSWYKYQVDSMKSAYTDLLSSNVAALKTSFGSTLDGEISPLVHTKVPPETLDRLLALIPATFKDEETFNLVSTNLKNLTQLKRELIIFKSYRINRG